jgi:hypothetical protein
MTTTVQKSGNRILTTANRTILTDQSSPISHHLELGREPQALQATPMFLAVDSHARPTRVISLKQLDHGPSVGSALIHCPSVSPITLSFLLCRYGCNVGYPLRSSAEHVKYIQSLATDTMPTLTSMSAVPAGRDVSHPLMGSMIQDPHHTPTTSARVLLCQEANGDDQRYILYERATQTNVASPPSTPRTVPHQVVSIQTWNAPSLEHAPKGIE